MIYFVHDMVYINLYEVDLLSDDGGNRSFVEFEKMIFDNDHMYSLVGEQQTVPSRNLFRTLDGVLNKVDKKRLIKDILNSKQTAMER